MSTGTIKTKAIADSAVIACTTIMSPTRTMAKPSAPRIAPRISRIRGAGFSFPPVPIMARVNPALTTLVTTNRKAANMVAVRVSTSSGNYSSSAKVVASGLSKLTRPLCVRATRDGAPWIARRARRCAAATAFGLISVVPQFASAAISYPSATARLNHRCACP